MPLAILERESLYPMPVLAIGESLREFEQREFSLGSNDGVDEVGLQRLLRNQAGMPPSENDWQVGPELFSLSSRSEPPTRSWDP